MSWIHDEDVRHYLKIIGAVVFFCILVLCVLLFVFKPEGKIELKSNTVEYGDKVTSIDLIKKVKGKDIADARHTKGSLSFPDLEITADELDTFELGKHSITYSFSDGSEDIVEVIEVKDTVKPEIKLKSKKIELSLAEAKKMTSWKKYYEISDNYPEAPTSTEKLDKEEFDYGDTVHLDIIVADASGNKSKAQLTIDIKEKEKPKEKKMIRKILKRNHPAQIRIAPMVQIKQRKMIRSIPKVKDILMISLIQKTDRNLLERIIFFLMDGI